MNLIADYYLTKFEMSKVTGGEKYIYKRGQGSTVGISVVFQINSLKKLANYSTKIGWITFVCIYRWRKKVEIT